MNKEIEFIAWLCGVLDAIEDTESITGPDGFRGIDSPYVKINTRTFDRIKANANKIVKDGNTIPQQGFRTTQLNKELLKGNKES